MQSHCSPIHNGSLRTSAFNGNANQNWEFIYYGDGYYYIKNRESGNYMTAPNSTVNGALISDIELSDSYLNQQLWKIKSRNSNGTYRIQSKARELDGSNLFLGISGKHS